MSSRIQRLAISNIAWDPSEDEAVTAVLHHHGVTGVEIAPTKWRDRPLEASPADVAAYRQLWEDRGLPIVSLQSLFFGRPDLQLFGDPAARTGFSDHLRRTIDLAAGLGARVLVFGSPKNRLRGTEPMPQALTTARDALHEVGEHAESRGTVVCIEANPPAYGCDFIVSTAEAVELCKAIDHPGVRVNGDLGGMTMANEPPDGAIAHAAPWLAHFHASEPSLAEFGVGSADHESASVGLRAVGYAEWVSIEMRAAGEGGNVAAVERAVRRARPVY